MQGSFLIWAVIFAAVLIVSPCIIIYVMIKMSCHPGGFSHDTLPTKGMPLDILAPVYDRYCPIIGLGQAFRQTTVRHAGLKAGEGVLDIGCGTGVLTRLVAQVVGPQGEVFGIDPAAKMIAEAKKNASAEGNRAQFRLAVAENLPFEDGRFDCVLSSAMLHHLPPELKVKVLSEAHRVLKPGGRFVLVDVDRPANLLWWVLLWPLKFWLFTKDQIEGKLGGLISSAGFVNVEKVGSWGGFLGFWKAYKSV